MVSTASIPVYAETAENPARVNAQASQCQGDASSCPCPTGSATPEERKHCPENALPNCTVGNDNKLDCKEPGFQNCGNFGKNTQAYKDCVAGNNLFTRYVNPGIKLLSAMIGLLCVIGIMAGGLQYVSAAGDPQKVANGKRHIWTAILAFIAYLFFFAVLNFLIPGGVL